MRDDREPTRKLSESWFFGFVWWLGGFTIFALLPQIGEDPRGEGWLDWLRWLSSVVVVLAILVLAAVGVRDIRRGRQISAR